jgi:glycine cleavage system aminomethyltransferase T
MPRTLVRFEVSDAAFRSAQPASPGTAMRLWLRSADGLKEAGVVTSACVHPALDRVIGLAYVRQGLEREPSLLLAPEGASSILIQVHLPKQ